MKNLIRIFAFLTAFILVFIIFSGKASAQQGSMNYQGFYDQLSPYGQWVENPDYGYVWIPDNGSGFTPYLSNGYWVLTDYGWTWVSNYNWGWATFHYGRWDYSNDYGWFWVPDNQWGPSWVVWRRSGDYYGWAPMRPGVSISVTFGNNYNEPTDRWVFVRNRDFERQDIETNYIDRSNNVTIINNSTVINKTYYDNSRHTTYVSGPERQDVEKVVGRTIKPVTVRERDKPGEVLNNDQLQIYRPEVQKDKSGNKLAPAKVTDIKDLNKNRNTNKQPQNKQILKDNTVTDQQPVVIPTKDQQPVVTPANKNNNNGNTRQKQSANPPNKNINKEKQPVDNPIIKNSTKENTRQKKNVNSSNDNIYKEKQPVINPANTNNTKENVRQKQNNTPDNKINKQKQPVVNPANTNNTKENVRQKQSNTPGNKINKQKQPVVNPTNKNKFRDNNYQNPNTDSLKNINQPPKKK